MFDSFRVRKRKRRVLASKSAWRAMSKFKPRFERHSDDDDDDDYGHTAFLPPHNVSITGVLPFSDWKLKLLDGARMSAGTSCLCVFLTLSYLLGALGRLEQQRCRPSTCLARRCGRGPASVPSTPPPAT